MSTPLSVRSPRRFVSAEPPALRVNLCTEQVGWILGKCGEALAQVGREQRVDLRWNAAWHASADVSYGIDFGYIDRVPTPARKRGALFCHYNPEVLGPLYRDVARRMDFCVAMSVATAEELVTELGVDREKVHIIELGVDRIHRPKLVLGIVGRTYPNDPRKGLELLRRFVNDPWVAENVHLRICGRGWNDIPGDIVGHDLRALPNFYAGVDYLLSTASREGGPMPLIEGLACGKLMISPIHGYGLSYPVIPYAKGNLQSLLSVVRRLYDEKVDPMKPFMESVKHLTWLNFAAQHLDLFRKVLQ